MILIYHNVRLQQVNKATPHKMFARSLPTRQVLSTATRLSRSRVAGYATAAGSAKPLMEGAKYSSEQVIHMEHEVSTRLSMKLRCRERIANTIFAALCPQLSSTTSVSSAISVNIYEQG